MKKFYMNFILSWVPDDNTRGLPYNLFQKLTSNYPQNCSRNRPQIVPEIIPKNVSKIVPKIIPPNVLKIIHEIVPKIILKIIPEIVPKMSLKLYRDRMSSNLPTGNMTAEIIIFFLSSWTRTALSRKSWSSLWRTFAAIARHFNPEFFQPSIF